MSTEKRTEYAVARGNEIITDWSPSLGTAMTDLHSIRSGMMTAHLEPDVHVVESEVEITTKRSRAKTWEDETSSIDAYGNPVESEKGEASDGSGAVLPASGVWGGETIDGIPVSTGDPGDAALQAAANIAAAEAGAPIRGAVPGTTRVAHDPATTDNSLPADAPELVDAGSTAPATDPSVEQGSGRSRSKSTGGTPKP